MEFDLDLPESLSIWLDKTAKNEGIEVPDLITKLIQSHVNETHSLELTHPQETKTNKDSCQPLQTNKHPCPSSPNLIRLVAENDYLRNRIKTVEHELQETIELLHIWKNNAYAYRLNAQMSLYLRNKENTDT